MTEVKILDLLERAHNAGCFPEVLKLIRSKSDEVLIEKIIQKSKKRHEEWNFNFDSIFGAD